MDLIPLRVVQPAGAPLTTFLFSGCPKVEVPKKSPKWFKMGWEKAVHWKFGLKRKNFDTLDA